MAKSFNIVAELQLQGPKNLNQITRQIAKSLKGVSVDVNLKIPKTVAAQLNQINKSLQSLNAVASQANQKAAQLSSGLQKVQKASAAAASANKKAGSAIGSTSKQLKEATSAAESFGKQSALAVKRFAAFSVSAGIMGSVVMSLKNGVSAAIEFERELVKVAQVTNKSLSSLSGLTKEISSLSTSLGASSQELVGVSRTLAQTGLSARDVTIALKALAQSSLAPTFKDMNNTVEGAISIMRQFGVSADDIGKKLGSINALAGSFAVEAQDLVFAVRRAGGAFQAAGGSLEELLSLFTSVRATTRESAETIATGFRTIFTRIQRPKTIAFLRETGVELQNLEGNFVGPFQAIQRLSKALRQMESTDPRFMQIIEELGGFRQVSKVIPLIQQFGTAQKALGVAMAGQDSLAKDAATAQQSLGVQIVKVREQFLALARDLVASDSFQGMAKMALSFASSLIKVVESVKPLLPLLTTLATFKTLQLGVQFAGGFSRGFGASGGAAGLGQRLGGGRRMATGGIVPGVGNTDSVPAMLTPGEFVIRKSSVEKYGAENIARLNAGGRIGDVSRGRRLGGGPRGAMYAKGRSKRFSERAMGSRKAYVFDFDDTLAVSGAVEKPGAADPYEDFRGKRGASFIRSAQATKIAKMARARASRGHDIHVLTARPGDKSTRSSIGQFMRGIGASAKSIIGTGLMPGPGGTAEKKAAVLSRLKGQYGNIVFLDDNKENVIAAGKVKGVKSIRAKYALGGKVDSGRGLAAGHALLYGATRRSRPPTNAEKRAATKAAMKKGPKALDIRGFGGKGTYSGKPIVLDPNDSSIGGFYIHPDNTSITVSTKASTFDITNEKFRSDYVKTLKKQGLLTSTEARSRVPKKLKGQMKGGSYAAFGPQEASMKQGSTGKAIDKGAISGMKAGIQKAMTAIVRSNAFNIKGLQPLKGNISAAKEAVAGDANVLKTVGGFLFESVLQSLTGVVPGGDKVPMDLPNITGSQRKKMSSIFGEGSEALRIAEVKRSQSALKGADGLQKKVSGEFNKRKGRYGQVASMGNQTLGKQKGMASGGGISGSDTVPALLTPGEFVVNKKSAQRIGYGNLNKINKGGIRGYADGGQVHKFNTGGPVPGSTTLGGPGSIPGMKKTAQANNNLAKSANKAAKSVGDSATAAMGLSNRMQLLYFLPATIQSFANTLGLAGEEFNNVTTAVNQAVIGFQSISLITRSGPVQDFLGRKGMGINGGRLPKTMRSGFRLGRREADNAAARFSQSRIAQSRIGQSGVGRAVGRGFRGFMRGGVGAMSAMGSVQGVTMLGTAAMTAASMLKAYGEAQKQAAMELVSNAEATETDFAKARGMAATGNRASSAGTGMMVGMGAGALAGAAIGTAIFPGIGTVGGAAIGGMLGMTAGGIAGDVLGNTSYDPALERQIQSTKFGQTTGRMQEGIQRIQQEGVSAVDVTSVLKEAGAGIEQRDEAFDFKQFKEFRSSLRQQLPALKALKSEMLKSADSIEDFQDKFGGAGRELQEKIADIEGVDVSVIVARDKAERELIEKLGANKAAQEAAIRAQQDLVRQLDIFKGSLQETSDSLNEMVLANNNAVASFGGGIGKRAIGSSAARGGIFSRAAAGQSVDADALEKAITSIAPTEEIKNMAQSAANASQKLPDVLFKAARESKLTGEKLELTLANELKAAGIGGAVAQSIQASIEGMTLSTQGSEQKLVNEIFGGGASDVAKKAIESLVGSGLLESFQEISNKLNEQAAQLDAAFGQIIQAERKLAKQRIGLINTRASNRQTLAMAQGAAAGRTGAEIGPQGRLSGLADFVGRQQAILGQGREAGNAKGVDTSALAATSAADVQALGNRFMTLQTKIADITKREARGETLDPGEVKELNRLREEAQQAGDNLNFLAESTDLLKNAQDRLASEQAKRQFRTGIATDFAFGTQETRQSMAMSMSAVDAFNRYSQGTGNLGPQALNAMGEAGQQAAAGGRQMLERMAAAGVKYQGRDASEILRETTRRQLKESPLGQGLTQDALDNMVDEMLDPSNAEVEAIEDMKNAMEIQEAAQSKLISAQRVLLDGIGAGILGLNPEFKGLREQFVNASNDAANAQVTATKAVEQAIRDQMAQDAETKRMKAEAEAETVTKATEAGINTQKQAEAVVQISKQQERVKKLQEEKDALLPEAFRGVEELQGITKMSGMKGGSNADIGAVIGGAVSPALAPLGAAIGSMSTREADETALTNVTDRKDVSARAKKSAMAVAILAGKIQSTFEKEGLINDNGGELGRERREQATMDILEESGFDPKSDVAMRIVKTLRNLVDAGTYFGGTDADEEREMLQNTIVQALMSQGEKARTKQAEIDKQQKSINIQAQQAGVGTNISEQDLEIAKAREKIDDKTAKEQVAAVKQTTNIAKTLLNVAENAKKEKTEKVDTKEVIVKSKKSEEAEKKLDEAKKKADAAAAAAPETTMDIKKRIGPQKKGETSLQYQTRIAAARAEGVAAPPAGAPAGTTPPAGTVPPQVAAGAAAESSRAAEFNMDEIMARANQIKSLPKGTPTSEGGADLRTRRAAYRARQGEELTREEKQLLSGQEISGEEGGRGTDSKEGGSLQQALQQFIETEQLSAALNNFSEQFGGDGAIKHELSGTDISVTFSGLEEIKGAFQEEIISQVIKRLGDTRNPNPDPSKPVQT